MRVEAAAAGYGVLRRAVIIEAGVARTLGLRLAPGAWVTGRALGPGGDAIAGVELSLASIDHRSALHDAMQTYRTTYPETRT